LGNLGRKSWQIAGVGDYNQRSDILCCNTDGDAVLWISTGFAGQDSALSPTVGRHGFDIAAVLRLAARLISLDDMELATVSYF
jgi:hypothetical protein